MAKGVRVTVGGIGGRFPSRTPGTLTAIQVNAFGLQSLMNVSGEELVPILLYAMEPAKDMAIEEWPKDTHASVETIDLIVTEVGDKRARVALAAGGDKLRNDPRNRSKKDYTPFIEFNGTSTTPPGTLTSSVILTESERQARLKEGIRALLESKARG